MRHAWMHGMVAGAAGTTALNAVTYLDMVLRARPASSTPEETVQVAEDRTHLSLAAAGPDSEAAANRRSGLGALLGIAAGLGTGALYGVLRPRLGRAPLVVSGALAGLLANVGTTGPMILLGVTDPRRWPTSSWVSDLVPHLAYGLAAAAVFEELERQRVGGSGGEGPMGPVPALAAHTDAVLDELGLVDLKECSDA